MDPDLTNSKCSYWHFRLDADTSMKMEALTTYIKDVPEVKKVYLINQNYSHGHQVSKFAKEMLKRKRPDIQIVGTTCRHWPRCVTSRPTSPRSKQSGADTVITGNWGSDLALLIKAANDAGLNNVNFYTYYGSVTGSPTAMALLRAGRVHGGLCPHEPAGELNKIVVDYKKKLTTTCTPALSPRLLHAGHGFAGQGQVHRPGQGGGHDGRHEVQELQRRGRNAQDRPPAPARSVHLQVGEGWRQVPHRL